MVCNNLKCLYDQCSNCFNDRIECVLLMFGNLIRYDMTCRISIKLLEHSLRNFSADGKLALSTIIERNS